MIINSESAKIFGVLAAACHQCHQSPCDEFYQSEKRGPDIPDPDRCGINHCSRNYTSSHSSSRHRDADYSLSHQSSSAILLELRMKVCEDFIISKKASTIAFSWFKGVGSFCVIMKTFQKQTNQAAYNHQSGIIFRHIA